MMSFLLIPVSAATGSTSLAIHALRGGSIKMPTALVEARDEQLSGVKYRGSARTKNVSGIEDMLDRLSVLASGMRPVFASKKNRTL